MKKKENSKMIIVVVLILAIIVFIYSKNKSKSNTEGGANKNPAGPSTGRPTNIAPTNQTVNPAPTPTNKPVVNGSLSSSAIKSLVKRLYTAMMGFGTDEQAIYNVFLSLKNQKDFNNLKNTFNKSYSRTMKSWLLSELSASEVAEVVRINTSKGINPHH